MDTHDTDPDEVRIAVQGMTCAHCVRAVTAAVGAVPGVSRAHADLETGIVSWHGEAERAAVRTAIEREGYAAGQ